MYQLLNDKQIIDSCGQSEREITAVIEATDKNKPLSAFESVAEFSILYGNNEFANIFLSRDRYTFKIADNVIGVAIADSNLSIIPDEYDSEIEANSRKPCAIVDLTMTIFDSKMEADTFALKLINDHIAEGIAFHVDKIKNLSMTHSDIFGENATHDLIFSKVNTDDIVSSFSSLPSSMTGHP